MIAVPARKCFAVLLLATSLCACSRKEPPPFQYEAQWLQAVWAGDAELKHTEVPRKDANEIREMWEKENL